MPYPGHKIRRTPDFLYKMVMNRHPYSVKAHRLLIEAGSVFLGNPKGTAIKTVNKAGLVCKWITGHENEKKRTILYLHGGGYVTGSIRTHSSLVAHLCHTASARALLVDYRLAPEYPFPAALEDAFAAYHALLDDGISPDNIAISGDSAGGGLTMALLMALKKTKKPLPAAAYLMSPWVDLTKSDTRFDFLPGTKSADIADWTCDFMAGLYAGDTDLSHPYISPIKGDFTGLPPIFISVGRYEPLRRQAWILAEKIQQCGVDVTYKPYRSPIHVAQAMAPFSRRAKGMLAKGGKFIKENCPRK